MQKLFADWLRRQVDDPERLREEGVVRFAMRFTIRLVVAACVINVLGHVLIDRLGLLPYPLSQALVVGLVLTFTITAAASVTFAFIVGQSILALSIQRDTFERLSNQDELSGLRNRRSFFECFERSHQSGHLILLDVDHFKKINDEFGHLIGDEVLRAIGRTLSRVFLDPKIIVGRVGGEEFAVFIPDDVIQQPRDLAEDARQAVETMTVTAVTRPVTISLGLAARHPPRSTIEAYAAADRALYLAKASGRNRLVHEDMLIELDDRKLRFG